MPRLMLGLTAHADARGHLSSAHIARSTVDQAHEIELMRDIGAPRIARDWLADLLAAELEAEKLMGVTFTPSFEIDGTLTFQPLGHRLAFFNGDLPLRGHETNRFIDAIIANGLTFQAFHMHYIEMDPQIWFIHWRGVGEPLRLAKAVHNTLKATGTPLPQKMPSNPKSPLDDKRLGKILHGSASIGDEGVVTVNVNRRDRIVIDGIRVSPEANISTGIEFKPLASKGPHAAVGPDFSLTSREAQPVVRVMRDLGWFVSCLYNQETSEKPQLYFSHMLKTGDAYALAHEIRRGLDLTKSD